MSSNNTSLLLSEAVDLYEQDKLFEAEEACEKAVGLDPNNLIALNTLLSLNFERGSYETAITNTQRALSLLRAQGVESEETQLLQRRIAECYLYLSKPGYVKAIAKDVKDDEARSFLLAAAERMQMVHDQVDPATQRRLVIDRIPSLKQCLSQLPEYFPTGHDQAESLFDEALQTRVTPQDDISLLFCGSGDARHVFATISSTASREREIGEQLCRNIHITMVDHSPPVFARNLLMFEMLSHYADFKSRNAQGYGDMTTVIAYIYISHLLPPFVYEKMLEYIDILLHKLNSGQLSTAGLIVAPKDIPAITKVLEHWKRGLGAEYRVADVRNYVTQAIDADGCLAPALNLARAGEFDRKSLRRLGVLFSSPDFVESRDLPSYNPLLRFSNDGETGELSTYINDNWKINSTLFDVDLKAVRGENYGIFTTLEFLPISIVNSFKSVVDTPYLTIPDFGEILDTLSQNLSELGSRLTTELVIGDMSDTMDRIRFGMLEHRAESTVHALPSKHYPRTYDRIHLSNIPDYTGGPLTAFIFSHPLLNKDRPSTLQYRCLLNPSRFRGHADFQSEYLNIYDDDQISQHFNFRRQPSAADSNPKRHELAASTDEYMSAFILEYYMIWERQDEGSVSPNKLLSRPNLEKWAYSMLLKICLPYYRPLIVDRAVEAPLNLMYFFRLMVKLSEVGYPAHWLSEIVREACSGIIYTTARPPTQLVTTPEVLDVEDPAVTLSLRAWAAELTSLLTIWHNLLPFGHISAPDCLPPLFTISQYSVKFPPFKSGNTDSPHFMMLFWNVEVHHQPPTDIRKYLLGLPTAIQGVHIVTCFKHDVYTNTSTFWLRDDVVENMRSGCWKVYIARTDDWTVESEGVNISDVVRKLGPWV